ncbi:hypothetical protein [Arthrobacter sp. B1805]|uniref:hypothetical protein n=1 Tax=Arthrobacter sp. B1805 TaxID=2058892 RepID=UPI0011B049AD|nr:hypothetical protein [Arthrobacter sp. B1805]
MEKPSKLDWQKSLRGVDLSHAEYRVLMTISTYTDGNLRNARPGLSRIIADACVNAKTARAALKSLTTKGYLMCTGEGGNQFGKGKANVYAIPLSVPKVGSDSLSSDTGKGATEWDPSNSPKGPTQYPPSEALKGTSDYPPSDPGEGGTDSRPRVPTIPLKGPNDSPSRVPVTGTPSGHSSGSLSGKDSSSDAGASDHEPDSSAPITDAGQNNPAPVTGSNDAQEDSSADAPAFSADVEELCNHLARHIKTNGNRVPTVGIRWKQAADRLIRIDGYTPDQIRQVIDWSQHDEFWQGNILSMSKLREKFDTLKTRMFNERNRQVAATVAGRSTSEQRIAELQALKGRRLDSTDPSHGSFLSDPGKLTILGDVIPQLQLPD